MLSKRRTLLRNAASLSIAAPMTLATSPFGGLWARAPSRQVVGVQHFRAGDGVVTALLDGHLELEPELFTGLQPGDVETLLQAADLAAGPVPTGVNAYVYRTDTRTMLFDAGGRGVFPSLGALDEALRVADIEAADVDTILCTHLHPDHVGAFVDDGAAVFPNAELVVHEADIAFWTSAENRAAASADFQGFFDLAAAVVEAYGDRLAPFASETDIAPGVRAVPLMGHTPGHSGFAIGDGEDGLLIWGDVVHVGAFQFARPEASIAFDVDPAAAVETRLAVFERVAAERTRIAGMHLDFPGIGHVVRTADGYAFEPASWTFDLD